MIPGSLIPHPHIQHKGKYLAVSSAVWEDWCQLAILQGRLTMQEYDNMTKSLYPLILYTAELMKIKQFVKYVLDETTDWAVYYGRWQRRMLVKSRSPDGIQVDEWREFERAVKQGTNVLFQRLMKRLREINVEWWSYADWKFNITGRATIWV